MGGFAAPRPALVDRPDSMGPDLEQKCTSLEAENAELQRLLEEANTDRQQLRLKVKALETRLNSLSACTSLGSGGLPPALSVVTSQDFSDEGTVRPKTSRGRARPSPEDFSDYVVPSPGGTGDSEEGILVLEDNAGQLPAASVHSKAQRAWDVK